MAPRPQSDTCPRCGLPKDRHTYVSRTTCVVAGPRLPGPVAAAARRPYHSVRSYDGAIDEALGK